MNGHEGLQDWPGTYWFRVSGCSSCAEHAGQQHKRVGFEECASHSQDVRQCLERPVTARSGRLSIFSCIFPIHMVLMQQAVVRKASTGFSLQLCLCYRCCVHLVYYVISRPGTERHVGQAAKQACG